MSAIQSGAREIRVFLSSTFKDMEEERSYLLTSVLKKNSEIFKKNWFKILVLMQPCQRPHLGGNGFK